MSAPRIPKNAPISIIPSRPMFDTPDRSLNMPPIAAKMSGVAYRSIAASSADQTTTVSSLPTPDRVARYAEGEAEHARGDREAAEAALAADHDARCRA